MSAIRTLKQNAETTKNKSKVGGSLCRAHC